MELRIGQGLDVHQFADGRKLILGGVEIPSSRGLIGHSDADALLHAITDAVLGATGRGDIGSFFPDTDAQYKGADSRVLFQNVWEEVSAEGWRLVNLDATLVLEVPKLRPHIQLIQESVAGLFGVDSGRCGIKATTCEKMGFLGRQEGLLAQCVVLLSRNSDG
jgi:2-C-methyl-D-erythritol 2,4-cyclodiphosphate synthase